MPRKKNKGRTSAQCYIARGQQVRRVRNISPSAAFYAEILSEGDKKHDDTRKVTVKPPA